MQKEESNGKKVHEEKILMYRKGWRKKISKGKGKIFVPLYRGNE
jgi:hypothetical protein